MTETLSATLPDDVEATVHRVLQTACDRGLTLATAESCTGGLIASVLTDVEGLGHAFERGFVVYTDEAKSDLLGLSPELIKREGAVSREVAVAMAGGGVARSGADICLAVTGFSGPAGPDDEPGLVHFACQRRGRDVQHREEHFGDIGRGATRIACLRVALRMIEASWPELICTCGTRRSTDWSCRTLLAGTTPPKCPSCRPPTPPIASTRKRPPTPSAAPMRPIWRRGWRRSATC